MQHAEHPDRDGHPANNMIGDRRVPPVVVSVAVATLTTVPTIGRQPLSWDEASTLKAARLPVRQLGTLVGHTDAPVALYYLLMHFWTVVWGVFGVHASAFTLRLPSAAAAIVAVVLLVRLTQGWFGAPTAMLAGCLFAVHPMLTFYAQDARPYTLVCALFLGSTVVLQRALRRDGVLGLAVYGAMVTVTLYLHFFAVYAVLAHALLAWFVGRRRAVTRWAPAFAMALLATAPLVIVARTQTGAIGWIPTPTPAVIASVLNHVVGGAGLAACTLLALCILVAGRPGAPFGFVLGLGLLPVSALVVVNFITPSLVARYALVAVPGLVLIVAVAVRRARRIGAMLAVAALTAGLATTAVQQFAPYKYGDYRAATDVVYDTAQPGAAVLFMPQSMRDGFTAYVEADTSAGISDPLLAAPSVQARYPRLGGTELPAASTLADVRRPRSVFLFGYTLTEAQRALTGANDVAKLHFLRSYRVIAVYRFGVVSVTVLGQ